MCECEYERTCYDNAMFSTRWKPTRVPAMKWIRTVIWIRLTKDNRRKLITETTWYKTIRAICDLHRRRRRWSSKGDNCRWKASADYKFKWENILQSTENCKPKLYLHFVLHRIAFKISDWHIWYLPESDTENGNIPGKSKTEPDIRYIPGLLWMIEVAIVLAVLESR